MLRNPHTIFYLALAVTPLLPAPYHGAATITFYLGLALISALKRDNKPPIYTSNVSPDPSPQEMEQGTSDAEAIM
jgi:hypothetical protein